MPNPSRALAGLSVVRLGTRFPGRRRGKHEPNRATEARPYDTLVVSLFGGPDADKSTLAHRLYADLAMAGRLVEYVPEFAKELVWRDRRDLRSASQPREIRDEA